MGCASALGGDGGASRPALPTGATITTSHWHSSSRVALLQSAAEVRTPMHTGHTCATYASFTFFHSSLACLSLEGPCSVRVYRFRDPVHGPRKIPAPHPGMLDPAVMAPVMPGQETHFVVQNDDLLLKDPHYAPGCELYRIGRHFRYEVIQHSAN